MIRKEILDKFRKLYEKKYGVILSDEETTKMANDLVNLMRILLKPDPQPEERRKDEISTAF